MRGRVWKKYLDFNFTSAALEGLSGHTPSVCEWIHNSTFISIKHLIHFFQLLFENDMQEKKSIIDNCSTYENFQQVPLLVLLSGLHWINSCYPELGKCGLFPSLSGGTDKLLLYKIMVHYCSQKSNQHALCILALIKSLFVPQD